MKSDRVRLQHIGDALDSILSFVQAGARDAKTCSAVLYQIAVIGEAARSLSPAFRDKHSHIPWQDIIGMRNRIIHEYFHVDQDVLWATVDQDIPKLRQWMAVLLDKDKK